MRQVLQQISGGPVEVAEVPRPTVGPTEVLVRTVASVISPKRTLTKMLNSYDSLVEQ
jgi:NADPH:quinone reductase-like Zn-dependent oxidoreductase